MSQRVPFASLLAVALCAAPATAFDSDEDDLLWVATGSSPSVNFNARHIVYTAAGSPSSRLGRRDMNARGPKVGSKSAVFPSIGYSWTRAVWQGDSGQPNEFCGFASPLYQIYLGAASPVAKLVDAPRLASRQTATLETGAGAPGNAQSEYPALSGDGGRVAFQSRAGNFTSLAAGCTNIQVYVHDFLAQTTRLVSVGFDGEEGDRQSRLPAISATGRYVAFESQASNLVPGAIVLTRDVFLRDVDAGTTAIVSHAEGSTAPAGGSQPSLSGDGRYVVYTGTAPVSMGLGTVVYVRDMQTDTAVIASRGHGPGGLPVFADRPSISADGRFVSFMTSNAVAVPDPVTLTVPNCVVRDLTTGENRLATRAQGPTGAPLDTLDGNSGHPRLSGSGRYVVFFTQSDTISRTGKKGQGDIYLRDVWGPPPGVDTDEPVLTDVRLTQKSFALPATCDDIASRSLLLVTSSEPGALQVEFRRKSGKKWETAATMLVAAVAGENTVPLNGCVGLELLPKGTLQVAVTVTDAAFNVSATKLLALKIK